MLYFFLSYARGDEDHLVRRFYEELCVEVRLQAGEPRNANVGFLDNKTIQVGQRWPGRLTEALARCGSFLALMTPRYFSSVVSGQEWQIFADRLGHYEAASRVDSSLLKPLMWLPMPAHRLPPVAEPIQYTSSVLGDTYDRLGVRQLMRLRRHEDEYKEFLFELAEQIVESVRYYPLPAGRSEVDMRTVESAFHPQRSRVHSTNPLAIHFVVAAGSRNTMESVRQQLGYYGAVAMDWSPFRPSLTDPIGDHAHKIALKFSFDCRVADMDSLGECARHAKHHNQIIVLLVDAWSTRLPDTSRKLAEYSTGAGAPTTAVMIPANIDDGETRDHWPDLSQACRQVFDQFAADDELYRSAVLSHRTFETDLPEVLAVAKNRAFRNATVYRSPPDTVSAEQPRVDATVVPPDEEDR